MRPLILNIVFFRGQSVALWRKPGAALAVQRLLLTLMMVTGVMTMAHAQITPANDVALPSSIATPLKKWGQGDFRRFGFYIYRARLWAGEKPTQPPLALRLDYQRTLRGTAIAEASVEEMRELGAPSVALPAWAQEMARIFPDVRQGDNIVGFYRDDGVDFYYNGQLIGKIDDGLFARYFFGIWLDEKTSAPELRQKLLSSSIAH